MLSPQSRRQPDAQNKKAPKALIICKIGIGVRCKGAIWQFAQFAWQGAALPRREPRKQGRNRGSGLTNATPGKTAQECVML